jgi:hypothetical protein
MRSTHDRSGPVLRETPTSPHSRVDQPSAPDRQTGKISPLGVLSSRDWSIGSGGLQRPRGIFVARLDSGMAPPAIPVAVPQFLHFAVPRHPSLRCLGTAGSGFEQQPVRSTRHIPCVSHMLVGCVRTADLFRIIQISYFLCYNTSEAAGTGGISESGTQYRVIRAGCLYSFDGHFPA